MGYIYLLLLLVINTVVCYYFYSPTTHELLIRSSLNDVPAGYKLIPPPRNRGRRRSRLTRGSCSDGGFTCNAPYDKSLTFQFECSFDDNCPANYKCCFQKCFLHKVCVRATYTTPPSKIINNNKHEGHCDSWPYSCKTPYDYSATYRFKCERDSQCPRNFKCCQQNCFLHRICSKAVTKQPRKIVPTEIFTTKKINEVTTEDMIVEESTTVEQETTVEEETTVEQETTVEEETTVDEETTVEQETTVEEEPTETTSTEEVGEVDTSGGYETTPEDIEEEETTEVEPATDEVTEQVVTEEIHEAPETELRLLTPKIWEVQVTVTPTRTTLDSNAIDPNYAENFYDSTTEDYEYEETDDDDESYE